MSEQTDQPKKVPRQEELISPATKKLLTMLMGKMEKNIKEFYGAQISSLHAEINMLKIKVTELETQIKRQEPLIANSLQPASPLSTSGDGPTTVQAKPWPKQPAKKRFVPGSKKPAKMLRGMGAASPRLDSIKTAPIGTIVLEDPEDFSPLAAVHKEVVARRPKSPRGSDMEPTDDESEEDEDGDLIDSAFSKKKKKKRKAAGAAGGSTSKLPKQSPRLSGGKKSGSRSKSGQITRSHSARSSGSSGGQSVGASPAGGGGTKYKVGKKDTTSLFVSAVVIGNRYALIDGRYGICKYYDAKADTLGIELEVGIGQDNSTYKGKERWDLDEGKQCCFVTRKDIEVDCGAP